MVTTTSTAQLKLRKNEDDQLFNLVINSEIFCQLKHRLEAIKKGINVLLNDNTLLFAHSPTLVALDPTKHVSYFVELDKVQCKIIRS